MPSIRELISQDDLEPVLNHLASKADQYDGQTILMLTSQFNRLKRSQKEQTINNDQAQLSQNRLNKSVSDLAAEMHQMDIQLQSTISPKEIVGQESQSSIPESDSKMRLLFCCSSPKGSATLDFSSELGHIEGMRQSGAQRDQFEELVIKSKVQSDQFLNLLANYQPHILHISLHSSKRKGLYFENVIGDPDPISVAEFKDYIELHQEETKPADRIKLIVLSACNSYAHGEAVEEIVDTIICMDDFIPDEASIYYAKEFYRNLFSGFKAKRSHKMATIQLKHQSYEPLANGRSIYEIPQFLSKTTTT